MAVEAIKKVATDNGWTFSYGSGEWQNLADHPKQLKKAIEDREVHLLLYNCDYYPKFSERYGGRIHSESIYKGYLIIAVVSDFNDKNYNHKWEHNIKPLLESHVETFLNTINGCGYKLTGVQPIKEVSNILDNNMDGLSLEYTLKKK